MHEDFIRRTCFGLCLMVGSAVAAPAAAPSTGADLAQLCAREAEPCHAFIERIAAAHGDDKTVCLPHGYQMDHLRRAYLEWASASDAELLAREPADQAVLSALKELFSCDE